jgi:hypothetical protein
MFSIYFRNTYLVSQLLNPDVTVFTVEVFLDCPLQILVLYSLSNKQKYFDVYDIPLKHLAYLAVWFCVSKLIIRPASVP